MNNISSNCICANCAYRNHLTKYCSVQGFKVDSDDSCPGGLWKS